MRKFIRTTALAALLLASIPVAQAAVQNYSFSGALDSGALSGQSFSGSFSFDDLGLTNSGLHIFGMNSLNMSFAGQTYTLADADVLADVSYFDGAFLGLSYSASARDPQVAFVAGSLDSSEAFISYETTAGLSGAGTIIYAPVPEPESYALLLAGLGLLGAVARRHARKV